MLLMCMKMRRAGDGRERRERAAVAVDRHVAHAAAGLVAGAGRDHLVVAKERAVEEDDVGAGEALQHRRGHAPRRREHRRCRASPARISTPTLAPVSSRRLHGRRLRDRAAPCPAR